MSKKMLLLVSVFVVASWATASAVVMIDDFESYADTAAMTATWMEISGAPQVVRTLDATGGVGGSQAMHWDYDGSPPAAATPWWVFSARFLNTGTPEDWSQYYGQDLVVSYKAASLSSNYEPLNGTINAAVYVYGGGGTLILPYEEVITVSSEWQTMSIDIEDWNHWGEEWTDVWYIAIGVAHETWLEADIMFDDLSIVPEPATLALLSLGGLLIRRRR